MPEKAFFCTNMYDPDEEPEIFIYMIIGLHTMITPEICSIPCIMHRYK